MQLERTARRRRAAGPACVACADRDGCSVAGLDRELFPVFRVERPWPVALARARGGVWVLMARDGLPRGRHRLERLGPGGAVAEAHDLQGPARLAVSPGGPAFLLARPGRGDAELLAVRAPGWLARRARVEHAVALAAGPGVVLVGGADGRLFLMDAACGDALARAEAGAPIVELAAAPRGRWWVATADGAIALLGPDLALRGRQSLGGPAIALAAASGSERMWVAEASRPRAYRLGPEAALEVVVDRLAARGVSAAAPRVGGGVLLATPGALLALGRDGTPLPGQGGFVALADVVTGVPWSPARP